MAKDNVLIEKLKNGRQNTILSAIFSELELQAYWTGVTLNHSANSLDKLFRGN